MHSRFWIIAALSIAFVPELEAKTTCKVWEEPEPIGNIGIRALDETSGMAASRKQKDVIWLHNDSGDDARVFALSEKGEYLGEWKLEGVDARDWEDIAIGPCPDAPGDCLWIADTGNNTLLRKTLLLHRVSEPSVDREKPAAKHVVDEVDTLEFQYPDGERYDAEALMVSKDGTFWIVTKGALEGRLFRGKEEAESDAPLIVERVGTRAGLRLVTAGDLGPHGQRFALRGYDWAMVFLLAPGQTPTDVFENETIVVPLAVEPQGESIAFTRDGKALLTTSEERHQPIFRYDCETMERDGVEEVPAVSPAPGSGVKVLESDDTTWPSCSAATSWPGAPIWILVALAFWARRWRL